MTSKIEEANQQRGHALAKAREHLQANEHIYQDAYRVENILKVWSRLVEILMDQTCTHDKWNMNAPITWNLRVCKGGMIRHRIKFRNNNTFNPEVLAKFIYRNFSTMEYMIAREDHAETVKHWLDFVSAHTSSLRRHIVPGVGCAEYDIKVERGTLAPRITLELKLDGDNAHMVAQGVIETLDEFAKDGA